MPTAAGGTPLSTSLASTIAFPGGGADAQVTSDRQVAFRVPVDEEGWVVIDPATAGELGALLSMLAGAALGYDEAVGEYEPEVDALRQELAVAGGLLTSARADDIASPDGAPLDAGRPIVTTFVGQWPAGDRAPAGAEA